MPLTGIEIYKYLPKTNCKECGFPTCLAFAMKVAQKAVPVTNCPYLSPEARAALEAAARPPILYAATRDNWEAMAELALKYKCPLAVAEPSGLEALAGQVEKISQKGVEDIVLDPGARDFASSLVALTQIRRLALKKNFRPLGPPVITSPGAGAKDQEEEALLAAQQIAKYAGVIVLDRFSPSMAYPLLALRLNIYTDPQKPIQVQPGVYQLGAPKEASPLCVTTNFSLP